MKAQKSQITGKKEKEIVLDKPLEKGLSIFVKKKGQSAKAGKIAVAFMSDNLRLDLVNPKNISPSRPWKLSNKKLDKIAELYSKIISIRGE